MDFEVRINKLAFSARESIVKNDLESAKESVNELLKLGSLLVVAVNGEKQKQAVYQISQWLDIYKILKKQGITNDIRRALYLPTEEISIQKQSVEHKSQGWIADLFEKNINAIVEINAIYPKTMTGGNATGFIVSKNGYLLTNKHVVYEKGNLCECKMKFHNKGERFALQVIATATDSDLALCKFDAQEVKVSIDFGTVKFIESSDQVKTGADVVAIGNGLSYGLAPTEGTVRCPKDACGSILYGGLSNQGDSGGPIFNREGEVIGMNYAIARSKDGSRAHICKGVTVDDIKKHLNQWEKTLNIKW